MKWFSHALRGYPHWPKTACVPKEWRWNLTPAWQETNQKKACNFHSTDVWDQTVYFLSVTSGVDFTLTRSSCSMLGLQNSFRVDIIHVCARVCVHHFLIVPERFLLIMKVDHVPKWTLFSSIYLNFGNELFQDLLLTSYIYIYTYVCMCVRARGRVGVYIYICVYVYVCEMYDSKVFVTEVFPYFEVLSWFTKTSVALVDTIHKLDILTKLCLVSKHMRWRWHKLLCFLQKPMVWIRLL